MRHSPKPRPVLFNLAEIQLPVGALTSITHRITGVLLALGVPLVIYLLDMSLQGPLGFDQVRVVLDHLPVKGALIVLTWALAHHMLAGVRHLLSDIDHEGLYLASESTMYRLQRRHGLRTRRRTTARTQVTRATTVHHGRATMRYGGTSPTRQLSWHRGPV